MVENLPMRIHGAIRSPRQASSRHRAIFSHETDEILLRRPDIMAASREASVRFDKYQSPNCALTDDG